MREEMLLRLRKLAEENYKEFSCKLIPGVNKERILGVRVPAIRKLAKELAKEDWQAYLRELEHCPADPHGVGGTTLYYEEIMMQGMIIAAAKMDLELRMEWVRSFVPRIDNWAVCDTFCGDLKFADKKENRETVWNFLQSYLRDDRAYFLRFGIVMLLMHYIDEEHIDRVLDLVSRIRHEGYYVKMAAAWNLSVCYVKFPEKTEALIRQNQMDDFTHNKTIQKIRESYRVSKADKVRLSAMKRK